MATNKNVARFRDLFRILKFPSQFMWHLKAFHSHGTRRALGLGDWASLVQDKIRAHNRKSCQIQRYSAGVYSYISFATPSNEGKAEMLCVEVTCCNVLAHPLPRSCFGHVIALHEHAAGPCHTFKNFVAVGAFLKEGEVEG